MNAMPLLGQLESLAGTPLAQVWDVAMTVCLGWAAAFLALVFWNLRSRRIRRQRFMLMAKVRDFSDEEAKHLYALSHFSKQNDPATILDSYEVFRVSVEQARTAAGRDLATWPSHLHEATITPLRGKMMTRRPSRFSLSRTMELERNQTCTVHITNGPDFHTYVARITPDDVRLSLPEDPSLWAYLKSGIEITVSFWRSRDARYEFTAPISDSALGMLFLPHSAMHRRQQRGHVRVRYSGNARLAVLTPREESPSRKRVSCSTVSLEDISAGGAAFISETPQRQGQAIMLELELPVSEHPVRVPARVIRATDIPGTPKLQKRVAVEFHVPTNDLRDNLDQLIAQLQQNLIRRFRTRVDEVLNRRSHAMTSPRPQSPLTPSRTPSLTAIN
jgi:c-di-GMP-binding flagellar brake protein YcgR